jgi:hypothetical protein
MIELPKDGSDQLIILLAACKFLDLLIALQMEDFQMSVICSRRLSTKLMKSCCSHQWMFLTDTVDAGDGDTLSRSESILDRLANLILETGPGDDVSPPTPCTSPQFDKISLRM